MNQFTIPLPSPPNRVGQSPFTRPPTAHRPTRPGIPQRRRTDQEPGTKNQEPRSAKLKPKNKEKVKIERFEDIEGWRLGRELTRSVYEATRTGAFAKDFGLKDQIQRASGSVMHKVLMAVAIRSS